MMMATCRGSRLGSIPCRVSSRGAGCGVSGIATSHRHDLVFLRLQDLVHALDALVRERLDLVVRMSVVVFTDLLFLQQLLQEVVGVAPVVAHRDAVLLPD